jgi:hypothetical protein
VKDGATKLKGVSEWSGGDGGHDSLRQHLLDAAERLASAFLVLDESEADVVVAVVAETDAVVIGTVAHGRVTTRAVTAAFPYHLFLKG